MANKNKYQTPHQAVLNNTDLWYQHYYDYLTSLAYQLFTWQGLPDSVDPRYLEMMLHEYGYVGFVYDDTLGYIVTSGTLSGRKNHYLLPTTFTANSPQYQQTFKIFNYNDMAGDDKGVVIYNNDLHMPTTPSIRLFAADLTENKMIMNVNRNAQKTPVLITANDGTRLSLENIYLQYKGNTPVIVANENFDPDSIKVHKTDAPFILDKLNEHKNVIWNEAMTYLGIKNTNQAKKERMITDEAEGNNEQITASANIYLKARQEACERINQLYPDLNVSVDMRGDIADRLSDLDTREGGYNGSDLYHTDQNDS